MQKSGGSTIAKRPTSFNQPFYISTKPTAHSKKSIQQLHHHHLRHIHHMPTKHSSNNVNNIYPLLDGEQTQLLMVSTNQKNAFITNNNNNNCTISADCDFNRILDTPTTPQFPMPSDNNSRLFSSSNETLFLQENLSDYSYDLNSFDTASDDFPWTPDTPSSDSKDPLMTDAVNIDTPTFSSFSSRKLSGIENLSQILIKEPHKVTISVQNNANIIKSEKTVEDFDKSTPSRSFYNEYSIHEQLYLSQSIKKAPFTDLPFDISAFTFPPLNTQSNKSCGSSGSSPISNNSSCLSSNSNQSNNSNKRKPRLHLLQFIYCLLNSSKPSQCVCWMDKDNCVFRIINPNKLTNLWGRYKQNPNMSFDSLSRSLRLYYASGRLERVAGQRNQYRFVNREESIDFNRKNKRKNLNQSQLSQQQQQQHNHPQFISSSTTISSTSASISSLNYSNDSLVNTNNNNNNTNNNNNKNKTSVMFGTKIYCNSTSSGQPLNRRII